MHDKLFYILKSILPENVWSRASKLHGHKIVLKFKHSLPVSNHIYHILSDLANLIHAKIP